MTVQITIVGLGQIGASVGLALKEHTELVTRIGHDRRFDIAKQAEKLGAVDKIIPNLPKSVRDADIVLLALPVDQIRETMEYIAQDLKEGVVVMDTAPVKEVVAAWAGELLPSGRHYVGLTPVINAAYLHGVESGVEAARADLFRNGMMAIVAPPRTSSEAIKLAADLTRLLGASALFADPAEIDGVMAATHLLPQILAAALLNATVDQPGWREGRKMAGRAYAEVTGPVVHLSEPKTLQASVFLNRDNVLRSIDSVLSALHALRTDILEENQDALEDRLERSRQGRERWWRERQTSDWAASEATAAPDVPSSSDVFGRLLGFGGRQRGKKK